MTQNTESTPYLMPRELWEKLKPPAREMRHDSTPAEDALWQRLRNRQVMGAKFRRQHGIERFIVDFVCLESRLIIEVDGPIHEKQQTSDAIRTEFLATQGFTVWRFSNDQVLTEIDGVLEVIAEALASAPPLQDGAARENLRYQVPSLPRNGVQG